MGRGMVPAGLRFTSREARQNYRDRLRRAEQAKERMRRRSRAPYQLLAQLRAEQQAAKEANLRRYEQLMGIAGQIEERYQPGGAFEERGMRQIERAKTKGVGAETQKMISAGLYGTQMGAGIERGWEEDVGAKARLRLEDIMQQRFTEAQKYRAGIIERREDIGPDYATIANLMTQIGRG